MTKPSPTITEREEHLLHELAALTREQSRIVQELVVLTLAAADPRAIPVGAIYGAPDEAPPMGDPDDDDAPTTRGRAEFDDVISLDALDTHPLSTVSAVPTVPTPANDDGGQP